MATIDTSPFFNYILCFHLAFVSFRQCPWARQWCLSSCPLCLCTPGSPPRCSDLSCPSRLSSSAPSISPCFCSWPGLCALPASASPYCWHVSTWPCTCSTSLWWLGLWPFWHWRRTKWLTATPPVRRSYTTGRNWRCATPKADRGCLVVGSRSKAEFCWKNDHIVCFFGVKSPLNLLGHVFTFIYLMNIQL